MTRSNMSRTSVLLANPRRTLAALGTVLVASGVAVGSGASFTSSSANPSNTFSTGTLSQINSKANAAILNASGLRPGDAPTGTVDIENSGSLSGTFSVARTALTDSSTTFPLSAQLDLTVADCGVFSGATPPSCSSPTTRFTGKLSAFTSSAALGTFAAGEKRRYQVTLGLPLAAGNEYQGSTATAELTWSAIS